MDSINQQIIQCQKCTRLVRWCKKVARQKRAAYIHETYWGKPVPSFGDSKAELLIVGLAPGAHGANRTGRMFTGDRSGDWLYQALFDAGFASQPQSISRNDGLQLTNAYISAVVHCAPPDNKPTPSERDRCLSYLAEELQSLPHLRVIVALGGFAWDGVWNLLGKSKRKPKFGHGVLAQLGKYTLLGSYHPSQQNTFTGRLTRSMLLNVIERANQLLASSLP